MNIIAQYTIDHLKRNRRSFISVIVAVLLASTLLCSFCIVFQGVWTWMRDLTIEEGGNWHGELFAETPGDMLPYVEGNPAVESVMIKGDWQAVRLPENAALPYFFLRDTNAAYWQDMSEKNTLMEGRIPEKTGEIAVSRLFFDRNPGYKVGDTLTLPVGDRMLDGRPMDVVDLQRASETFGQTAESTLTIVGKLDLTTSTASPGYYAMGFLDENNILPDDGLTIYLRFHSVYDTYTVLPQIAQSIGLQKDEYGEYPLKYNSYLLNLYGISSDGKGISVQMQTQAMLAIVILVLAMGAFVTIIHSVFSLSADARAKQLGMFRSVGATPKQIRRSILLEGVLLATAPVLVSAGLGYGVYVVMAGIFNRFTATISDGLIYPEFSLPAAAIGMMLSMITVLLSASIPARKMAKLTPIEAVRGGEKNRIKRRKERKRPPVARLFGFNGTLALDTLAAHKKSFRSPVAALCLSFSLLGGMLFMVSGLERNGKLNITDAPFDVTATIYSYQERDDAMLARLRSLSGVQTSVMYSYTHFGVMVDESWQSKDFTAWGGFPQTMDNGSTAAAKKENGYRLRGQLLGLADDNFRAYCASLGIDPEPYLNAAQPKAVVYNAVPRDPETFFDTGMTDTIDFLSLQQGQTLTLMEQYNDSVESDYIFPLEIGALTRTMPETDNGYPFYMPVAIVPIEQYDRIVVNFLPERAAGYRQVEVAMKTGQERSLAVETDAKELLNSYMGEEDYDTWSKQQKQLDAQGLYDMVRTVGTFITLLIALIGVSNAFSAVAGNLAMRRREFAMLRSVGLDNKGFGNIMFLEGLFFAIRPILFGIPLLFLIGQLCLILFKISWAEFLPVMPVLPIALYALAVLAVMGLAYWNGARQIRKDTIVDALRDEVV